MISKRKLPIGIQDFEKIRKNDFIYIDKTEYIYDLAQSGAPCFLSRPRRFGKSLLLSTMRTYFEGKKELFEGLRIMELEGDGEDAWVRYPVFYFDLNKKNFKRETALEEVLSEHLRVWEGIYGDDYADSPLEERFQHLIELAVEQTGRNAVVLVDEYDKPLLETMDMDELEELRLADKKYGSTKQGIAPFYSDKYAKIGIQVNELFDEEYLKEKLENICTIKNALLINLYHKDPLDKDELFKTCMDYRDKIEPYLADTALFLDKALKEGKTILLEGQLGTMKDPDHGIYPMVTSSHTLAGYGAAGAGIPPYEIKQIVAVTKAYSSAVGAGVFTTEITDEAQAEELRRRGGDGGEYGATTGRPRRMGWYDCVASKYGCRLQGATDVALSVLDVLGYLDEIPVCTAYEIDGKQTKDFPTTRLVERAKPVYEVLPGWKTDISGIRKYEELPENCRRYIEFIEKELGYPITMISNSPSREDIIYR